MLIQNRVKLNGNWLIHTYSDKNFYVKRLDTGKLYVEAYDPVQFKDARKYEETSRPLTAENTESK